jgi:predicted amidohydrolase YtcJ
MRRYALRLLLVGLAAACSPAPADLVLVNGRIITVDADDRVAQALAVRAGRIVAVGADREIERLVGPSTRRVDLAGRAATPGLLDAHNHFASGALSELRQLSLSYPAVQRVADAVRLVGERAASAAAGQWVLGRGWDEGKLAERRYLRAADLDSVSGGRPVWLTHTTGHYGVANGAALALAKIDRSTPDPPNGTIDRYPDRTPTGVLKESAMGLVSRLIPEATAGERVEALGRLAKEFNRQGMTGAKDPGIGGETWEAYRAALANGSLTVRIMALWSGGRSEERTRAAIAQVESLPHPPLSTGDDRLFVGGIKLFSDGSGGARTAWLWRDWNRERDKVDSGNPGYPAYDPEIIRRQIRMIHDAGLHVSVHAVGDRAIDWVLDSYAEALAAKPTGGLRHGLIHANIPTEHALELLARLQAEHDAGYPEPSATFTWWIGDTYAGNFGAERSARLNPFRTFLARGIRWANSSDFPVTPYPARYGIWSAVTRESLLGVYGKTPFDTAEAIGVRDALRAQTIWVARQMFLEGKIGSLEVGKYADVAVWDRDPYTVPADQLDELVCELTVFNGEIVYQRSGGEPEAAPR